MNIRIQSLSLTNFKCFRSKEFQFGEDIVTIRGRNGVGKTTIFDAILFCLFGKNSQDQTKFNIKTHDEQGNIIPHLDHAVEMTLELSKNREGIEQTDIMHVTLRHSVKEEWKKKRGYSEEVFAGDTHEYFVNGELYTAKDYKTYIASLIDEQTFRILTNPQYFPSLKWQDQRAILTKMVGDIEPEVIANTEDLAKLVHTLDDSNDDIVAYKKHLSYQIKKVKEQLDKIPVRLEEQNKALPEKADWDSVAEDLTKTRKELAELEAKIASIMQGGGSDVKREEITNQISKTTVAIDKLRIEAQAEEAKAQSEKRQKVSEFSIKFNNELNNQKLMDQTIEADKRMIERCEESIKECENELERLRLAWPNRKFSVDGDVNVCPTCGQPLPADVVEGKIETLRQNFNAALEAEKQSLREKAAKVKKDMEAAKNELQDIKEKLSSDEESLEAIKANINTIFAEKAKVEKQPIKSADEILSENGNYIGLMEQLGQLKAKLETIDNSDDKQKEIAELSETKSSLNESIEVFTQQLAGKVLYDKVLSLIEGINEEQKSLVEQLSELERKEDVAKQYEDRQNEILEERVNEHFKITRWKMFRTVVNGGDSYNEPYCECYDLNGTAYHDGLNQAARLNAGLDIINAMANIYGVSAPVIIDQSESTLNILETVGQQLRLTVADTDLQII